MTKFTCKHCGNMSDYDYGGELIATVTMGTKEETQILYEQNGLCKECGRTCALQLDSATATLGQIVYWLMLATSSKKRLADIEECCLSHFGRVKAIKIKRAKKTDSNLEGENEEVPDENYILRGVSPSPIYHAVDTTGETECAEL